jgi:hypothetical protein
MRWHWVQELGCSIVSMKSSLGFIAQLVERQAADEKDCTFETRSGHFDRALLQPFVWLLYGCNGS